MSDAATATAPATLPMPALRAKSHEIWVGLFVLAGIFAVAFTLFTLTDPSTFRGRTKLVAHVPDASGIRRGDPVQMRGVNIGRTKAFALRGGGVDITLEIDKGYEIPADSKVVLRGTGLLGEMVAEVIPGTSAEMARPGAALAGSVAGGPFAAAESVASQADKTLQQLQKLLDDRTVGNVQQSTEEVAQVLSEISGLASEQRSQLRTLTSSLQRSAKGVESAVAGPELQRSNPAARLLDGADGRHGRVAGADREPRRRRCCRGSSMARARSAGSAATTRSTSTPTPRWPTSPRRRRRSPR
ncbi:MAG: MlaD family protein [Myxococcales bacterium]